MREQSLGIAEIKRKTRRLNALAKWFFGSEGLSPIPIFYCSLSDLELEEGVWYTRPLGAFHSPEQNKCWVKKCGSSDVVHIHVALGERFGLPDETLLHELVHYRQWKKPVVAYPPRPAHGDDWRSRQESYWLDPIEIEARSASIRLYRVWSRLRDLVPKLRLDSRLLFFLSKTRSVSAQNIGKKRLGKLPNPIHFS